MHYLHKSNIFWTKRFKIFHTSIPLQCAQTGQGPFIKLFQWIWQIAVHGARPSSGPAHFLCIPLAIMLWQEPFWKRLIGYRFEKDPFEKHLIGWPQQNYWKTFFLLFFLVLWPHKLYFPLFISGKDSLLFRFSNFLKSKVQQKFTFKKQGWLTSLPFCLDRVYFLGKTSMV